MLLYYARLAWLCCRWRAQVCSPASRQGLTSPLGGGGSDGGLTAGRDARTWGKPDPRLFDVVLPDFFEVDFVRVYDEGPDGTENENSVRN